MTGFYMCDLKHIPEVIATMSAHRAHGVVVCPVQPGVPPMIHTKSSSQSYFDLLRSKAKLTFNLPREAFFRRTPDGLVPAHLPFEMVAVLCQFGVNGNFKKRMRPERTFSLEIIPDLNEGPRLGVLPTLLHRVSPLAAERAPTQDDDFLSSSPPFRVSPGVTAPEAKKSKWDPEYFERETIGFPCTETRAIALEAMRDGVDPFRGDISKTVDQADLLLPPGAAEVLRTCKMKEVAAGNTAGPFSSSPYAAARTTPESTVPKDRYDPTSTRQRPIALFNASDEESRGDEGRNGSINDCCYSPRFLSFHLGAHHIRDFLMWLFMLYGPGISAWTGDIPSCFRGMHNNERLLPLFLSRVITLLHGTEWFVDKCNPFGWQPSEWTWQAVLAMILWIFRQAGFSGRRAMLGYVDNFFTFSHASWKGGDQYDDVRKTTELLFKTMGISLHEMMTGELFKGLGWDWDTSPVDGPPIMWCREDKYTFLLGQLPLWASETSLPLKIVEKIIGILNWISSGFPIGRAHVGYLRIVLHTYKGKALHSRGQTGKFLCRLTPQAKEALHFWAKFFASWDRKCPVFLDFGPCSGPEAIGRVDSSTDWGCGGFVFLVESNTAFYFKHQWTEHERQIAFKEQRVSTGVLEAMGARLWAKFFAQLCANLRVLLEIDHESVARAINSAYSPTKGIMDCVRGVCMRAAATRICLRCCHVTGIWFNQIADRLSHDLLDEAQHLAMEELNVVMVDVSTI
jgi:hypothetical protein